MIKSMTGYGSAEAQLDNVTYLVEIKTVNNRYFKTKLQLPETFSFLEDDIENLLPKRLSRGMINFNLHVKNISDALPADINENALTNHIKKFGKIASNAEVNFTIDLSGLLSLSQMMSPALSDRQVQRLLKIVTELAEKALQSVMQMRQAEGAALAEEFEKHCSQISSRLQLIQGRSGMVLKEYAVHLKERVEELTSAAGIKLDEASVEREVAVFAERSDICEEITRLESHIRQFITTLHSDAEKNSDIAAQAGRRLDFICQEMLREANTIASKASDAQIVHTVVDIKCLIDRIKEQVQNVE